jgi:hypothetical protein
MMAGMDNGTKKRSIIAAIAVVLGVVLAYMIAYRCVGSRAALAGETYNLYDNKFEAIVFWPALKIESFFSRQQVRATWMHDKAEKIEPF